MLREYELMFILDINLPEDERRDIANKIEHELVDLEGRIQDSIEYGVRDMAFPIDGVTRGDYRLIKCELEPSICEELQERLNFRDDILRYLLINTEEDLQIAEESEEEKEETT
ncbi:MAG: 30S ribosomal protein S6 [bacterium]